MGVPARLARLLLLKLGDTGRGIAEVCSTRAAARAGVGGLECLTTSGRTGDGDLEVTATGGLIIIGTRELIIDTGELLVSLPSATCITSSSSSSSSLSTYTTPSMTAAAAAAAAAGGTLKWWALGMYKNATACAKQLDRFGFVPICEMPPMSSYSHQLPSSQRRIYVKCALFTCRMAPRRCMFVPGICSGTRTVLSVVLVTISCQLMQNIHGWVPALFNGTALVLCTREPPPPTGTLLINTSSGMSVPTMYPLSTLILSVCRGPLVSSLLVNHRVPPCSFADKSASSYSTRKLFV